MKKILPIFLIGVFILSITGCQAGKSYQVGEVQVLSHKVKTVKTPVFCKPTIEPNCEFKGEGFTPMVKATMCITKLKKIIEECTGQKIE